MSLAALRELLGELPGAVVAFSGGTDSSFLAYVAHDVLGERSVAVTADSPSLARAELDAAVAFAAGHGIRHEIVSTREFEDELYLANGPDRCASCKDALMVELGPIARRERAQVLLGVVVDDLGDHRPGQAAAAGHGGRFPLVEAGLSKADVRALSRTLGLATWDKPAGACLSSRLAYGVAVTRSALARVEASEESLRRIGFTGRVRVRDQGGDLARVEVEPDDLPGVVAQRAEIVAALRAAGFVHVTLDLEGYRQGSHNHVLRAPLPLA